MTINSQKRLFLIILTDLFFYLFRSNMHKLVPLFWQLSGRLIGELFFLRNINKLKGKKKCMLIRWKLKTKFYLCWTSLETIGFCCDNCLFEVLMEIQITRNLNFFLMIAWPRFYCLDIICPIYRKFESRYWVVTWGLDPIILSLRSRSLKIGQYCRIFF